MIFFYQDLNKMIKKFYFKRYYSGQCYRSSVYTSGTVAPIRAFLSAGVAVPILEVYRIARI